MQIPLEDIKEKKRARKNSPDIEPLMESMKRYGLLNPITVNSRYALIAGARRLEAARRLGWRTINAIVLDGTDSVSELEIELEENTQRVNLTDEELMAAYTRLEKLKNPNILVRIWRWIVNFFRSLFAPKR
ncbi:MAG TPA: ParB N-terminal domain-containing protein [Treponemataceae bacterium]|nr:ParB N-terminal domain-containing protein [Treponemataceae bacterium]HPS45146.1 ParB N-terminal domain-containing protein [Treponemataceae bacterium]